MHERDWTSRALTLIEADYQRSADTHLVSLPLDAFPGVDIYFKDESTHPSGSLKHRLARSLFLYALCNGWIQEGRTVVEASSGSTAVSEAYFAKLIGVPFVAVMPRSTSQDKIKAIEFYGGRCHYVTHASEVYAAAHDIARQTGGHYIDQFTYAERATDWRGNNNIAESIFRQMQKEAHPVPAWIVVGAGTGGTSATVCRYVRFMHYDTHVCVVDPEFSVFYDCWQQNAFDLRSEHGSRIEGIGRPQVEPSFIPGIIDRMEKISDARSIAAMRVLSDLLNRPVGPSTGTNFWGTVQLASEMVNAEKTGSIVTLICDSGLRYSHTYYNPDWLRDKQLLDAVDSAQRELLTRLTLT